MISIKLEDKPEPQWNARLLNSKLGTMFQTSEYAKFVASRYSAKPKFLSFLKGEELVGQLLIFESYKGRKRLSRYLGRGFLFQSFSKINSVLPKFYFWAHGPIIFTEKYTNEIFESLGNLLKSWKANFKGAQYPLVSCSAFSDKFNFKREKTATFIIDLTQEKGVIFKKTDKHSVQKNIKRSIERGVKISSIQSEDDLTIYYKLQKQFRKENKNIPYEKDDIFEAFRYMSPAGYNGFIAWFEDKPIGAISFSSFNGYINELGIARTKLDYEKKLYSLDLLRWKIIEWGIENGCQYYDMSGVKPQNRDQKEEGIFRNKRKWGGAQYNYWVFYS